MRCCDLAYLVSLVIDPVPFNDDLAHESAMSGVRPTDAPAKIRERRVLGLRFSRGMQWNPTDRVT